MSSDDDAIPKTITVHIHAERVAKLNKAAIRISFETGRTKPLLASQFAQYVLDNYMDEAEARMIAESKKT